MYLTLLIFLIDYSSENDQLCNRIVFSCSWLKFWNHVCVLKWEPWKVRGSLILKPSRFDWGGYFYPVDQVLSLAITHEINWALGKFDIKMASLFSCFNLNTNSVKSMSVYATIILFDRISNTTCKSRYDCNCRLTALQSIFLESPPL